MWVVVGIWEALLLLFVLVLLVFVLLLLTAMIKISDHDPDRIWSAGFQVIHVRGSHVFTGIRHLPHVLSVHPTKACPLCATPSSSFMVLYVRRNHKIGLIRDGEHRPATSSFTQPLSSVALHPHAWTYIRGPCP